MGVAAAAGITAAAGLAGSALQSSAAGKGAAAAQQAAAQQRNDLMPFRQAGLPALQAQQDLLGLNGQDAATAAMANYQTSPGYQWQLGQGLRAVDAGAAAQGMLRSGATLKAEQTFGQGLANSDFGTYYNRLMDISKLGENAAAGNATTANTSAALAQGAGNTQASIYGNAASGLSSGVNELFKNQQFLNGIGLGGNPYTGNNVTVANPALWTGGL